MEDLEALLNQHAAEAISSIDSIDADFAAHRSSYDAAVAKHAESAKLYATPKPSTLPALFLAVQTGDRSFACTDSVIFAAVQKRNPQTIALLVDWLWSQHKVYALPDSIRFEVQER